MSNKKGRTAGATDSGEPTKPAKASSLSELQKFADLLTEVPISLNGNTFMVDVRRMRPEEEAKLAAILDAVTPPIKTGKTPEDDRIDFQNPAFIKAKATAEITARALALYWCVPLFGVEKPGLANQNEITEFVQSKLTNAVLNILYAETRNGGIRIPEMANFFSGAQPPAD